MTLSLLQIAVKALHILEMRAHFGEPIEAVALTRDLMLGGFIQVLRRYVR